MRRARTRICASALSRRVQSIVRLLRTGETSSRAMFVGVGSPQSSFAWTCHQHESRCWQRCFGLWASIGISGAVSGSIRAESLIRSEVIPPTPAPSIAAIFPPTFYPFESVNAHIIYAYARSQAVASLNRLRGADHVSASKAWLLYGCFIRIVLDVNARDSKSTEAQDLKFLNRIK